MAVDAKVEKRLTEDLLPKALDTLNELMRTGDDKEKLGAAVKVLEMTGILKKDGGPAVAQQFNFQLTEEKMGEIVKGFRALGGREKVKARLEGVPRLGGDSAGGTVSGGEME